MSSISFRKICTNIGVVATRAIAQNGLGLTATEAADQLDRIESLFTLLDDPPTLKTEWRRLVVVHQVIGKNAHDARLVAAMNVYAITSLLTFNEQDFRRFPGITILNPSRMDEARPSHSGE